jgi:hypothetical protein
MNRLDVDLEQLDQLSLRRVGCQETFQSDGDVGELVIE